MNPWGAVWPEGAGQSNPIPPGRPDPRYCAAYGIAGLCLLDGAGVDERSLETLAGPAGGALSRWARGCCALFGVGWDTASASLIVPPEVEREAGNSIAFTGRLDNRPDLFDALGLPEDPESPYSDSAVVLACYGAWGTATAARLLGDFAFAIWDRARSSLYCARDYSGIKPLYYARQGRRFVLASEISRVIRGLDRVPAPNEGMVAERLIAAHENRHETLYEGVLRLPPGWQMTVAAERVRLEPLPGLTAVTPIRYRREAEYLEHFIDLFRRAVAVRLPPTGDVGAMLSGGLDSSSVVGIAARLAEESGRRPALSAYSVVFPGLELDESRYISAVVEKWGLRAHAFPWGGFAQPPDWLAQARAAKDIPDYPTLAMTAPLMAHASASGVRTLLTGEGGDFWLTGTRYPFWELLAAGRLLGCGRELAYQWGRYGPGYALKSLLGSLLWPVVPARVRARAEGLRRLGDWEGFLKPDLVRRVGLLDRLHCNDHSADFARAHHWHLDRLAFAGRVSHYLEITDRSDGQYGVQRVHPLMDRRIAEFALAVPDHVHHARQHGKLMLRRPAPAILPPVVRDRLDRGEFSVVYTRALGVPQVAAVLGTPGAAIREWVTPEALDSALQLARSDSTRGAIRPKTKIRRAWMMFAVEAWQRGVLA